MSLCKVQKIKLVTLEEQQKKQGTPIYTKPKLLSCQLKIVKDNGK